MSLSLRGIWGRLRLRGKKAGPASRVQAAPPLPPNANELLCQLAGELLYEVVPLRGLTHAPDLDELRARLITLVRTFQRKALEASIESHVHQTAQYALCTLLDEVISSSDWGRGAWSRNSLLMIFHNETAGGEGFFALLETAELKPVENLALLELMYLCLALGLEGRYRVQLEGRSALAIRRSQLYETIRLQRGYHPRGKLNEHLRGLGRDYLKRRERLLWWVTCLLLLGLVGGGAYYLEERSHRQLQALQANQQTLSTSVAQTLAEKLATDIHAGRLRLLDDGRSARMILSSAELFATGDSQVMAGYRDQLQRIARALDDWPGRIQVIGHSDDTPVAKRLGSNQALSQARAESVLIALVGERPDPERFQAQGRGDAEPLFANDSAQNRARNRRVEILVYGPELPSAP